MAIWRTPCDRYIGVTASEEAGVMKTCWRAADRGKSWEGSQHLRHWEAGGCPSDVDSERQRVSCLWGYLSHSTRLSGNKSPACMFINPSTSQPQGSGCDVQVAGSEVPESWKMGLYSPAGKGRTVWGSNSPCSWALPYASLPFFPLLGCSVSFTGTCRSQGCSSLPLSLPPTAGTATHVGKGPLLPSATVGSMKNRLHWMQSSQVMLNLQFPMLNHHGNTQCVFICTVRVWSWNGKGQVILVVLCSVTAAGPRPSAEGVPLQTSLGSTLRTQNKKTLQDKPIFASVVLFLR